MGVEVVGRWHLCSVALTRLAGSCRGGDNSAAKTVNRCFWGDRNHLRASGGGRPVCARASMREEFSRGGGGHGQQQHRPQQQHNNGKSELEEEEEASDRSRQRQQYSSSPCPSAASLDPPTLGDRTFRLMRRRLASASGAPGPPSAAAGDGVPEEDGDPDAAAGSGKKERIIKEVAQAIGDHASGVKIPSSLRDLKRKARARSVDAAAGSGSGGDVCASASPSSSSSSCCAVRRAFASMVFMIRTLQSYGLYVRDAATAAGDADSQEELTRLLTGFNKDVQTSFLWLFEQVYSCTPRLMLSLMLLLSNFTVFSMASTVASATPTAASLPPVLEEVDHATVGYHCPATDVSSTSGPHVQVPGSASGMQYPYSGPSLRNCAATNLTALGSGWGASASTGCSSSRPAADRHPDREDHHRPCTEDGVGELFHRQAGQFVSSTDSDQIHLLAAGEWRRQPPLQPEDVEADQAGVLGLSIATSLDTQEKHHVQLKKGKATTTGVEPSLKQLLEETVRELELKTGQPYHHVYLDQETIRRLVAPVTVKLEHDDYVCFDRTDLEYQHAIGAEPCNPLLLANYAQFLYVVRRKHDSADTLFQRAMKADPADGEVIGRYASFMWLARGDCAAADKAYKAAIALDPCNPFFTGSYAHFLWHSEGDSACLINPLT